MRVLFTLFVGAAVFVASSSAILPAEESFAAVKNENDHPQKQLLRVAQEDVDGNEEDEAEEERFLDKAKDALMKYNVKRYLDNGKLPSEVTKKFKLNGLGDAMKQHKNYKYLDDYTNKWTAMGEPIHVSRRYHQKMLAKLKDWSANNVDNVGALSKLDLVGLHGKKLTSHKNYQYYVKYLDMIRTKTTAG